MCRTMPVTVYIITTEELGSRVYLGMSPRYTLHSWFQLYHSVKWIGQGPATCRHKWQKPRIIKCVKDILLLLRIFLWSLWTSSLQIVNVSFPWTWEDIYDYVDQWNKAKVTLCNFKASHKRHVLVPCSFLKGRLHAVRNLNNHMQRTHGCLMTVSAHQAMSTASPWSEWGFKWL